MLNSLRQWILQNLQCLEINTLTELDFGKKLKNLCLIINEKLIIRENIFENFKYAGTDKSVKDVHFKETNDGLKNFKIDFI